ncbi:hypothetical protein CPB86DRAFT_787282 [Serendipita vermifera]|nr:hypothetical protein CPB86DRAFT_787282 [Serendipita vermifera]
MATFNTLPVEIVEEIITTALLSCDTSHLPTIGLNASWFVPPFIDLDLKLSTWEGAKSVDPRSAGYSGKSSLPLTYSDLPLPPAHYGAHYPDASPEHPPLNLSTIAKSLRLVNRVFNAVCASMLYDRVNLLANINVLSKLWRITHYIIIPHSHHIHTLYIYAEYSYETMTSDVESYTAGILSACRQLTTLGLYYCYGHQEWTLVPKEILLLLEEGRLAHLGIYSQQVLMGRPGSGGTAVNALINLLSESEKARKSLKTLELAVQTISMNAYIAIRSRFPCLQSLTFRGALRAALGRPWDPDQRGYWTPYQNLRRLQLRGCPGGYSAHIPFLVHLFPALRELLVSTCGQPTDPFVGPWPPGWSRQPDALYRTHKPLDLFHIEHMDDWEMRAMGTVPTTTLMVTTVRSMHLLNILQEDRELFPGLRLLRLAPFKSRNGSTNLTPQWWELASICRERGIEIRRDAISIYVCSCSGEEGF